MLLCKFSVFSFISYLPFWFFKLKGTQSEIATKQTQNYNWHFSLTKDWKNIYKIDLLTFLCSTWPTIWRNSKTTIKITCYTQTPKKMVTCSNPPMISVVSIELFIDNTSKWLPLNSDSKYINEFFVLPSRPTYMKCSIYFKVVKLLLDFVERRQSSKLITNFQIISENKTHYFEKAPEKL